MLQLRQLQLKLYVLQWARWRRRLAVSRMPKMETKNMNKAKRKIRAVASIKSMTISTGDYKWMSITLTKNSQRIATGPKL